MRKNRKIITARTAWKAAAALLAFTLAVTVLTSCFFIPGGIFPAPTEEAQETEADAFTEAPATDKTE
ncbi:MAG: hypothetical protein IKY07_00340, partial [Clostridia bacterium]|nr:hypothetical protein [Clostridia bacterium]